MGLNIVFGGTPVFAEIVLRKLLGSPHSITAIYTQPDRPKGRGLQLMQSPVKTLGLAHQIPIVEPVHLKSDNALETFRALKPDVFIVVAYGLIIPPKFLTIPRYGCINVHPSLLPKYRGAAPILRALLSGESKTGVTIMQMDEGLDTGDMLLKAELPISNHDTTETLESKLAILGADTLLKTLDLLMSHHIKPIPQNDAESTYAEKIQKTEALIDWNKSAAVIDCQIRAFNPRPGAYTFIDKQLLKIWEAELIESRQASATFSPGSILQVSNDGIDVVTREGVLRLKILQFAGGKRLSASDILKSKASLFQINHQLGTENITGNL